MTVSTASKLLMILLSNSTYVIQPDVPSLQNGASISIFSNGVTSSHTGT